MIRENILKRYCHACRSAYPDIRRGESFDLSTGQKVPFAAHPFLLEQLSLILEESPQDVLNDLQAFTLSVEEDGSLKVVHLKPCAEVEAIVLPQFISNEDLIKLTIFFSADAHRSLKGSPPSPEDAIFPVKNALEIPDDFMPDGLMELVEGRPVQDYQSVPGKLNTSFAPELLFPIFRFNEKMPVGLDSIIPSRISFSNTVELSLDTLLEALKNQLEKFKNSESFKEFLIGRIFRSLKYVVQRGKSRELKKPLFTDEKILLLNSTGIVDQTGEIPHIRDDLSAEELIRMSDGYEKRNNEIALNWKQESIRTPGTV